MRGAQSFAAIILKLPEVDLDVVGRDEAFDDIILWLVQWRADATVDATFQRLIGTLNYVLALNCPNWGLRRPYCAAPASSTPSAPRSACSA
jgi:hypothetical protein